MTKKTKINGARIAAAVLLVFCLVFAAPAAAEDTHEHASDAQSDCIVCKVAGMINALPEANAININNAADVTDQIHAIDRIKFDLTDDEYDELLALVDDGDNGSGGGLGVPVRYMEAVTKIQNIGDIRFDISKWFYAEGTTVDVSNAEVVFKITPVDVDGFTEPLTVTMTTMDYMQNSLSANPSFYSMNENGDGWTYSYPLPAGTYKIEEVSDSGATVNGEPFVTTSTTYTVNGEEIAAGAEFEVSGQTQVLVGNAALTSTTVTLYDGNTQVGLLTISDMSESVSVDSITKPENPGYILLGWGLQDNDEVLIKADGSFNSDATSNYISDDGYWVTTDNDQELSLYAKWEKEQPTEVERDEAISDGGDSTLILQTTGDASFVLSIPQSIPMTYNQDTGNYEGAGEISLKNIVLNADNKAKLTVNVTSKNSFKLIADGISLAYTMETNDYKSVVKSNTEGTTIEGILEFDPAETQYEPPFVTKMKFTHYANGIQLAGLDAQDTLTFKVTETPISESE